MTRSIPAGRLQEAFGNECGQIDGGDKQNPAYYLPLFFIVTMAPDINKYAYYNKKQGRKKKIALFVVIFILLSSLTVFFFTFILPKIQHRSTALENSELDIIKLWNDGRYDDVINISEKELKKHPMDTDYLMFYGMAQYYKAYYEKILEDKLPMLNEAVFALRKSLLNPSSDKIGEIYYVLGQAYYHKGKFYYDLTVEYIENSIEAGYHGSNAYEYIALAYGGLSNTEKELEYFLKAYENDQTDLILLSIGKAYLKINDLNSAKDYLLRCLNTTSDHDVEKECRFNLADIYLKRNELLKAEAHLDAIIKIDKASAEAHFQLGELYSRMNNIVKAVSEWKKTLGIDPTHYGAKRRLYK